MIEHRSSYQGIENPLVYLPRIGDGKIKFTTRLEAEQALNAYIERFGQGEASKSTVAEVEDLKPSVRLSGEELEVIRSARMRGYRYASLLLRLLEEHAQLLKIVAVSNGAYRLTPSHDQATCDCKQCRLGRELKAWNER